MKNLLAEIKACTICTPHLELGPNPVLAAGTKSKIAIVGQAPGRKVHLSGVPWDDKSGDKLRGWLGVTKNEFYDIKNFALIPMGFCYPGKGKGGDLPPRKECAPEWHDKLLKKIKSLQIIILIGQYSQNYYLNETAKENLTETVKNFKSYLPKYFPLPHPSPRNNIWLKKNPWFEKNLLPELKKKVRSILY